MKAMILAAGEGTRLRPFTLRLPKPAIPFLGVPLVDHGLRVLEELGPVDLVVNHHHLSEEILRLFQRPVLAGRKIEFSDERSGLLGSGGGVHKARAFLENQDHFAVMNGDELILTHRDGQVKEAWEEHEASGRLATILAIRHPEVGRKFGGIWCENGNVRQFSKTPIEGLEGWHYVGILFLSKRVFPYFKPEIVEENLLYETLTLAMSRGEEVRVHPLRADWFETGNPADFLEATERCLDAILSDAPPPWAPGLRKFLSSRTLLSPLIESDETLLMHKYRAAIRKLGWAAAW